MKRFTLRNKEKIVKAHGYDYYNLLMGSLESYFVKTDEIVEYDYEGLKTKIIHVPSTFPNSQIDFEFAVISKTFDVYNLAYYSAIG
jgi:hypothetical protein